ncbi:hypothetical protein C0075_24720, partial [Rhizobium sp. KAs_5_22]
LLDEAAPALSWRELNERAGASCAAGVEPEALWHLGERHGYQVAIAWSEHSPGHLLATFSDPDAAGQGEPAHSAEFA